VYESKPWLAFYGDNPATLQYVEGSMVDPVFDRAQKVPRTLAYEFFGKKVTFSELTQQILAFERAFQEQGVRKGDVVTLAMPNCPSAIVSFYALNKIGAVSSLIHPLSTSFEIERFLNTSGSRFALTLDAFFPKFEPILRNTRVEKVFLSRIGKEMDPFTSLLFFLRKGRKLKKVPPSSTVCFVEQNLEVTHNVPVDTSQLLEGREARSDDLAVILYSGGTTGTPKGICLSNRNFNVLAQQLATQAVSLDWGRMLAILPIFHGFGLGVCVHSILFWGGTTLLVPTFTARSVAQLIRRKKPAFIAGVPTLFEALSKDPRLQRADLSGLRAVFSGGDRLPQSVKEKFDALIRKGGGSVGIREGYGLTEVVTAATVMPAEHQRPGSVGIPLPDVLVKVVHPEGGTEEVPPGEDGEICISGPTVMQGYYNLPEETAKTLKVHPDGHTWLHTGDIGNMDSDGFLFFKQRKKRMIKVSGVGVFPSQVEEVLNAHPDVASSCVIGVPDPYQIQKVKAFIILKHPVHKGMEEEKTKELIDYCKTRLIKWSCPREIEFRKEFPKTLVGKVAFRELEREEMEKLEKEKRDVAR